MRNEHLPYFYFSKVFSHGRIWRYCVFKKVTEDKNLHNGKEIIKILERTGSEELRINSWPKFLKLPSLKHVYIETKVEFSCKVIFNELNSKVYSSIDAFL